MARESKIERLEREWQEAEARAMKNLDQRNKLSQEFKALCKEEEDEDVSPMRLLKIARRKKAIRTEYNRLDLEKTELTKASAHALMLYRNAQRDLKEARRVLDVIENPPGWGLGGDYSPHQLRLFQQKAERTIKELT